MRLYDFGLMETQQRSILVTSVREASGQVCAHVVCSSSADAGLLVKYVSVTFT